MRNDNINTLFGGAAILPKGSNQDAASTGARATTSDSDAATVSTEAVKAAAVAAIPDDASRRETLGTALAAPARQEDGASKKTYRQLAVVCALAAVCGLAGGIAGGAAATAAGLGSSSSIGSSMSGGPGNVGGHGGMNGMGATGAQDGADGPEGMTQDGSPSDSSSFGPDGQTAQPNGPSSNDGAADDAGADGGSAEETSDDAVAQAAGSSSGEIYNA